MQDIDVSIDLSASENFAKQAIELLQQLRKEYDLSDWEFTHQVNVAPNTIPHSHPVLTLNTQFIHNKDAFLAVYLHEQIHWGISLYRHSEVDELIPALSEYYPDLHGSTWGVARDSYSTYLHIVVNWLEIAAVSQFLGENTAKRIAEAMPFYQKIYRTVLDDWAAIEAQLTKAGILPFPKARRL